MPWEQPKKKQKNKRKKKKKRLEKNMQKRSETTSCPLGPAHLGHIPGLVLEMGSQEVESPWWGWGTFGCQGFRLYKSLLEPSSQLLSACEKGKPQLPQGLLPPISQKPGLEAGQTCQSAHSPAGAPSHATLRPPPTGILITLLTRARKGVCAFQINFQLQREWS